MPRFIVIPREDTETFADVSPEEMQAIVQRYHAWSMELAGAGRLHMGEKLKDGEGKVLRGPGPSMSVTDGGFWIVEADDLDHAVEVVSGCPHLENGSLEIREIEVLD